MCQLIDSPVINLQIFICEGAFVVILRISARHGEGFIMNLISDGDVSNVADKLLAGFYIVFNLFHRLPQFYLKDIDVCIY